MKKYFFFLLFFYNIVYFSFSQTIVSETSAPFILANAIDTALSTYQSVQNSLEQLAYTYKQLEQTTQSLQHLEWNDINSIKQSINTISDSYFKYNNEIRDALNTPIDFFGNYTTLAKLPTVSFFDDYKDPFDINNYKGIRGTDRLLKKLGMASTAALINDLIEVNSSPLEIFAKKLYSDQVYKDYEEKRQKLRDSLMNDQNPSFQKTLDYLAFSLDGLQSLIKTNIDLAAEQQISQAMETQKKENEEIEMLNNDIANTSLEQEIYYRYNAYKETSYSSNVDTQIDTQEPSFLNMVMY